MLPWGDYEALLLEMIEVKLGKDGLFIAKNATSPGRILIVLL
jgi:hypothetical protein